MVTRARRGTAGRVPGSSTAVSERGKAARVGIDAIVVDTQANPRRRLRNIDELAASIRTYGLLQPLVVREVRQRGQYLLVAGHRRLAALSVLAERYPREDWQTVQVIIRRESEDDAYLLTLVENLQRQDLSPREESEGLAKLVRERQWSTRRVAAAIGRSQPFVSRRLRVYEDRVLRALVLNQRLSVSVAEELLAAEPGERAAMARRAIEEEWTRSARGLRCADTWWPSTHACGNGSSPSVTWSRTRRSQQVKSACCSSSPTRSAPRASRTAV